MQIVHQYLTLWHIQIWLYSNSIQIYWSVCSKAVLKSVGWFQDSQDDCSTMLTLHEAARIIYYNLKHSSNRKCVMQKSVWTHTHTHTNGQNQPFPFLVIIFILLQSNLPLFTLLLGVKMPLHFLPSHLYKVSPDGEHLRILKQSGDRA